MNILAVDTSTKDLLLTVSKNGEIFSAVSEKSLQHSKILFSELENLLEKAEVAKEEINCISVNLGPGSFTGIRIGVVFAKGMAYALGTNLVSADAFTAIAIEGKKYLPAGIICEERNGGGYFAVAKIQDGEVVISKRGVYSKEEISQIMAEENIEAMLSNSTNSYDCKIISGVMGLVEIANKAILKNKFDSMNDIEPVYIKKSQAEEQLEEKLKKQNAQ